MEESSFVQILLINIMPTITAGIVLLILEYLTPWFARSLQTNIPVSLPTATEQQINFDRQSVSALVQQLSDKYSLYLADYATNYEGERTRLRSLDLAKVLIWKLDRLGQSHLRAIVVVLGGEPKQNRYFEVICTQEGEIGDAHELGQLPQEPKPEPKPLALTSPPAVILIGAVWALSSGITVGILWGTGQLSRLYSEKGLDLYKDSLLLMVFIVAQTALITPALFTFLAHTLQKLGARVMTMAVAYVSFILWPLGTLLLGAYPLAVMDLIDGQIALRVDFQRLFLGYKMSTASGLIWATDITLLIFVGGLVLGLALSTGWCLAEVNHNIFRHRLADRARAERLAMPRRF